METSFWILLLLASVLSFVLGRRWAASQLDSRVAARTPEVSQAYLQGVNLLLNERTDDAIEALLPLLEIHPEMAETQLSLGRAFRRRGEFERAIRVHEHLLRYAKNASCKQQALLELAQDYFRAGILDRAEKAFHAVLEVQPDELTALRALAELFEQQKDWTQAIDIRKRLLSLGYADEKSIVAILYCEIAEECLQLDNLQDASHALRKAYESDPDSARGTLLAGRLAFSAGQTEQALVIWSALLASCPESFGLVLDDFLAAADCVENHDLQHEILHQLTSSRLPRHLSPQIAEWLSRRAGAEQALAYLYQQIQQELALPADLKSILNITGQSQSARGCQEIQDLVQLLPATRIQFQCGNCGYRSSSHCWKCPGCRRWDTLRSQEAFSYV